MVAASMPEKFLAELCELTPNVVYSPDARDEALLELLRQVKPEVLIVRSARVSEAMMKESGVRLVVRGGSGYDTIDLRAASEFGVLVANCPGKNAAAVAELAFGLILAIDRRIPENVLALRNGEWKKGEFSKVRGLKNRALGVVGLGNVGRQMVPRALAFGMSVVAWSRSLTLDAAEALGIQFRSTIAEVAASCDILTIHLALVPATRRIIDKSVISRLATGSYFINTARAGLVDTSALGQAIAEKGLRVGVDVFDNEPSAIAGRFCDPLATIEGVYGTHHIGGSTEQAQSAVAEEVVRIIKEFLLTGSTPNLVAIGDLPKRAFPV